MNSSQGRTNEGRGEGDEPHDGLGEAQRGVATHSANKERIETSIETHEERRAKNGRERLGHELGQVRAEAGLEDGGDEEQRAIEPQSIRKARVEALGRPTRSRKMSSETSRNDQLEGSGQALNRLFPHKIKEETRKFIKLKLRGKGPRREGGRRGARDEVGDLGGSSMSKFTKEPRRTKSSTAHDGGLSQCTLDRRGKEPRYSVALP